MATYPKASIPATEIRTMNTNPLLNPIAPHPAISSARNKACLSIAAGKLLACHQT
jgi:hypothetical protein